MDYRQIREEDLQVLAAIVQDENARPTDRIQAIKIREAIIAESSSGLADDLKMSEQDVLGKIRGAKK